MQVLTMVLLWLSSNEDTTFFLAGHDQIILQIAPFLTCTFAKLESCSNYFLFLKNIKKNNHIIIF